MFDFKITINMIIEELKKIILKSEAIFISVIKI